METVKMIKGWENGISKERKKEMRYLFFRKENKKLRGRFIRFLKNGQNYRRASISSSFFCLAIEHG